ncbi:di-heme enzyme [Alcaligenes faecalis]|uniref:methanobactin export MATE transporter MbnM n=1 Tax=Alcaligenes faecalis TaxID=511 RepID=UPI0019343634|nr:methanobactin export MATE transporter MbnM [Alcaligenes faecalis]QRF90591.1 di-heme enzyme [Alcaligenes faecalis]
MKTWQWAVALTLAWITGSALAGATNHQGDWTWVLPSHVPEPRVPEHNPMSKAKVELGRHLFYDTRLSVNNSVSCASCHVQQRAFTDGRPTAIGATGEHTHRNALGLANSAWHGTYNWANPATVSLEQQMETPLFGDDPIEMGVNDGNRQEILKRLRSEPVYPPLFKTAFEHDAEPLTMANIIKAISAFQRSMVSVDSRYDRYLQGQDALTESEERGMTLFFGEKAECHHCHGSFNFNDQVVHKRSRFLEMPFHNDGLYNLDGKGAYPFPNRGVFESTALPQDMGAFRAPSLRNVEVTGPYMHDGSVATLAEVIEQYSQGGRLIDKGPYKGDGRLNPYKSGLISKIDFSEQEKEDLLNFLKTLTDQTFLNTPTLSNPWP